jgi:hypothetical protein
VNLFLDDSGAFNWHNKGESLFAGLTVPDRNIKTLVARFEAWRRSIIGKSSRRELKGEELSDAQLRSFVHRVLPPKDRGTKVTVVGANTSLMSEKIVAQVRDDLASQYKYTAELVTRENPANKPLIQFYVEMSNWIKNRSTSNFLWVSVLEVALTDTLQHSIAYHMEPSDDSEFENIEIVIDQSFIVRERHIWFWHEWLRSYLSTRMHSGKGMITPHTWAQRKHPFLRKYGSNGLFNLSELFRNHMNFQDSKKEPGLQIADICAHICYRHWRADHESQAYVSLRPRIVGMHGTELHRMQFDERSVIRDGIENHVRLLDVDAIVKKAAERITRMRTL